MSFVVGCGSTTDDGLNNGSAAVAAGSGGAHQNPTSTSGAGANAAASTSTATTSAETTGSSAGAGGMPPTMPLACDKLGAVDAWELITPPGVANVLHVLADPVNTGTIYAGTANTGVYKSIDCGATWAKINTGKNADLIDSGGQWTMAIDPVEPKVLYAGALYGKNLGLLNPLMAASIGSPPGAMRYRTTSTMDSFKKCRSTPRITSISWFRFTGPAKVSMRQCAWRSRKTAARHGACSRGPRRAGARIRGRWSSGPLPGFM